MFETDSKNAKDLLSSINLESKILGLKELFAVFGKCKNLSDQLQIFGTKCLPLVKAMLGGLDMKNIQNDPNFKTFILNIRVLLT